MTRSMQPSSMDDTRLTCCSGEDGPLGQEVAFRVFHRAKLLLCHTPKARRRHAQCPNLQLGRNSSPNSRKPQLILPLTLKPALAMSGA